MPCITNITEDYRRGVITEEDAVRGLFLCEDARKIAYSRYKKWENCLFYYEWTDVLTEAIYLYNDLLRREREAKQSSQGKETKGIRKPESLFWLLCDQTCYRWCKEHRDDQVDLLELGNSNPNLYELFVKLLGIMGFPCGRLLFLYYLDEPPVKDYQKLFDLLKSEGEENQNNLRVTGPAGIPNLLTNCRKRFRDFLQSRPESDDLFSDQ